MTAMTNRKPGHNLKRAAAVRMNVRRVLVAVLLAAGLVVVPGAAGASAIHTVCRSGCDFTSVNAAVSGSSPGEGIEVMPGIYPEKVDVTKKLIIFGPASGPRPVIEWDAAGETTVTIEAGGAGTTLRDLDIRGGGFETSALVARGAVTATELDLTARDACATLGGAEPSQLGPGVRATASPDDGRECVVAGLLASDVVTGVTVNAPGGIGIGTVKAATVTDSTVNARTALEMQGGTVRRSTLNGTGYGVIASAGDPTPGVVSDSVITSTADYGIAVLADSVDVYATSVKLRNVTAIAGGIASTGLEAESQHDSNVTPGAIAARNVIARGTGHDVLAVPGSNSGCGNGCASGHVAIGYSNFRSADGVLDTTIGHNQSADPLLVNPTPGAGQDFHIASASSPLIGAGTADASDGPSDRDGVPHPNSPAIGAYEYPVAPSAAPGISPPGSPGVLTTRPGAGGASTRPTISQLAETNAVFTVTRASTPLQGRTATAAPRRGTIFSFRLDRLATVTVVITTSARCPRGKAGTRRDRRCSRMIARLTRSAHAGMNKLSFSGRIAGRPLRPGDYRAVFVATSAGGSSGPKTLRFRIAR